MEYIEKVKRLRNREEKVLEEIIKDYNQYVSAIVYKIHHFTTFKFVSAFAETIPVRYQ